jgi:hypothetical protein
MMRVYEKPRFDTQGAQEWRLQTDPTFFTRKANPLDRSISHSFARN